MKKLILATAFLLALASAKSPFTNFDTDPLPECPPMCDDGGNLLAR